MVAVVFAKLSQACERLKILVEKLLIPRVTVSHEALSIVKSLNSYCNRDK